MPDFAELLCRIFKHRWKDQRTGRDLSKTSWSRSLDSYVVCARCGISYSVWIKCG